MNKAFISFALILACAHGAFMRQDSPIIAPEDSGVTTAPDNALALTLVSPMTLSKEDYEEALAYGFKFGDICHMCYPGCYLWKQHNDKCDTICNFASCNFDNHHCPPTPESHYCHYNHYYPSENCPWYEIGNGKCNWKCFNGPCAYDGGDCFNYDCDPTSYNHATNCNPKCLWRMVGNGYCDHACMTYGCYYDFLDCCPKHGTCDFKALETEALSLTEEYAVVTDPLSVDPLNVDATADIQAP